MLEIIFNVILHHSSGFNPVHLLRIVTSVTPDASEMCFCVVTPPSDIHARYNAAAARPIGSFPATMPIFFALFSNAVAFRLVFSPNPAILAILAIPFIGSATGTFRSSSLKISL